ncbi:hypothetical protein FQA47_014283 [Oryzias melastigma]|uniref:UPAR/Ly6 domain-containing protein n=1 Tax=Oryzias melastigma TaxID=30732 RepID=A0A834KYD3_ORYME|nr:sperm acrosome membrane-associated protein 4 [Oryzias melastigma]KAF6735324.1 hypothetical protein FQA47_014283 [Oryzias melastigma]
MNNYWKSLLLVGVAIAAAHALDCRQCTIGVFGSCLLSKDVTCNNATEQCYFGDAQFNATGSVKLHTRGCLDTDLCNKTLTGTLIGAGYTSTFTCCTSNLCNGATSVQLPLMVALLSALLSSLWGM